MNKLKKQKGITLIALVVTIIILIILAGVTINFALNKYGILNTAKDAAEKTTKEALKEQIQFQILDLQTEEITLGENLTHEKLAEKLQEKLDITTEVDGNEITGEYQGYDYTIDERFNVIIGEKQTGISIKYTLSNEDYTNQDITLTVEAKSSVGNIRSIQAPDNITKNSNGTYTIKNNGTYEFTAEDDKGNRKTKHYQIYFRFARQYRRKRQNSYTF